MPATHPSWDAAGGMVPAIVPDYELLRLIGAGAYGQVWLARSTSREAQVCGGFDR